ncbi:MAG: OmpW family protein [Proteobacteria bacterium]|nr:OmpW family protein [Pseudomonadota bacterium]
MRCGSSQSDLDLYKIHPIGSSTHPAWHSATAPAQAFDTSKVTARFRAIYIDPADKSDPIGALAVPKDGIDVEDKWAPDIDFEYALTEHIGLELLLTIPQKHEVIATETALGPEVRLGTVTHLPPTLTAKYYFLTDKVRPYVGAALQAGVDFQVNDR